LAPEFYRTIVRALYIHGKAVSNFIFASVEHDIKPNDLKSDFIPNWPVLYPNAPQFRDLPGDKAAALIAFYDSLRAQSETVEDWWEHEGQLLINIFIGIRVNAENSLNLALNCIQRFDLEEMFPPPYAAWGTLTSRIERPLASSAEAMKHHLARAEAKAAAHPRRPGRA
jgi:hypothetical protein